MDVVKILEVEKEVLKRIDIICRFACCKYSIKQGSIINIKGSNIAYVSPHIITIMVYLITLIYLVMKKVLKYQ